MIDIYYVLESEIVIFFFHTANFIRSYVHLYDVCVCVWRKELSGAEANKTAVTLNLLLILPAYA